MGTFRGGGEALLLSISEDAFAHLHRDLQGDAAFVAVESLANQTVALRAAAVADIYFSSEAYDDYGPEHDTYGNHIDVRIPDARDWEIIECLAFDGDGVEDFDPADVERVRNMIVITDEQYKKLIADGRIKAEGLEGERAKNKAETDLILNMAHMTTYQLSTGQKRSVYVDSAKNLYNAFHELTEFDGGISADDMIRLEAEGRHRIVFINKKALDYVMMPTHKFDQGRVEADAAALDA